MSNSTESLRELRSLNAEEVESALAGWGQKRYRTAQLLGWLYKKRASSIDEMSDLPQELREQLAGAFFLKPLELAKEQRSRDGTVKFLWRLADGELIESVLIPASSSFLIWLRVMPATRLKLSEASKICSAKPFQRPKLLETPGSGNF